MVHIIRRMFSACRMAALVVLVTAFAAAAVTVAGQGDTAPGEYQVKAAILFNFAKFVEWPENAFPSATAPLVIGILGDDPFGSAFDAVKDKLIKGRKVRVLRLRNIQAVTFCHILFISSSEKGRLTPILKDLMRPGMLLVGDMEKFAQRGGMINFVVQNDTIDFEINVDAVQRAGIRINSRLLNMARIVRGMPSGKDE